jgi:hypothetical protein
MVSYLVLQKALQNFTFKTYDKMSARIAPVNTMLEAFKIIPVLLGGGFRVCYPMYDNSLGRGQGFTGPRVRINGQ